MGEGRHSSPAFTRANADLWFDIGVRSLPLACWASLWTDRAVAYRTTNGISHCEVGLAVVVQQMVDAGTAGVLFTANPVTGTRTQTVIDASPGPGQAVVSGAVNPDHFVVETATGRILQQAQGWPPSLTDSQLRDLTSLGDAAQRLFGAPQDVEWVIDGSGKAWLTQSRPITTLYPLPDDDPLHGQTATDGGPDANTRVYLCGTLLQGLTRPITPMGLSVLGLMRGNKGPWKYVNPGLRMYVELTPFIRNKSGRKALMRILPLADGRSATAFPALLEDPRFSVVRPPRKESGRKGTTSPARRRSKGVEGTQSLALLVGFIPPHGPGPALAGPGTAKGAAVPGPPCSPVGPPLAGHCGRTAPAHSGHPGHHGQRVDPGHAAGSVRGIPDAGRGPQVAAWNCQTA